MGYQCKHPPWLYATQSQNTAVQCGLDTATQISSTPNFIVQCTWFQAACNPRSSHGCQCSAVLHLLYVVKQQHASNHRSPSKLACVCWCLWASTSTACISTPNMVRHNICRHNYAVKTGLVIGFCGQPHYWVLLPTLLSESQVSISLVIHGLWRTISRQVTCRHVHINKIWRWTGSTSQSGRWCSHMAGIHSNCSTREIITTFLK